MGTYLKSRCEKSLPRNIMGIGKCMQRNQLKENFFVFPLRKPIGRLSIKVRVKSPRTRAIFALGSIMKNNSGTFIKSMHRTIKNGKIRIQKGNGHQDENLKRKETE
jgi:hypothetical protein